MRSLRTWFIVVLSLGSLGILAGWHLRSEPVTLAVPLAVMTAYLVLGVWRKERDYSMAQFADSIYYLGFLFTLVSLTVSLLALSGLGIDYNLSGLVYRFGLALITTVVGLATRICLTNFNPNFEQSVERSEDELARAVNNFRTQLDRNSIDMIAQNELMNRTLREAIETTAAELKGSTAQSTNALRTATNSLSNAMDRAGSKIEGGIAEKLEGIDHSVNKLFEALTSSFQGLAQQIRRVGADMNANLREAIQITSSELQDSGKKSSEAVQGTMTKLLGSVDSMLGTLDETLREINREFRSKFESTFSLPENLIGARLTQPLAEVENTLSEWNGKVAGLSDKLESVSSSWDSLGQNLTKYTENARGLEEVLKEIRGALPEFSGLSTEAMRLLKGLGQTCNQLTAFETGLREHSAQMKDSVGEDLRIAREHRARLEEEVSHATEALNLVHKQLIDSVQYIHDQLKE